MKKIRIDYYQLDSMKRFYPKTSFINTESKLYFFNDEKILKLFYEMDDNKLYTLSMIDKYKNNINIEELVLNFSIVELSEKIIGTTSDYIKGSVLSNILYNPSILLKEKIEILKKLGLVLEKMKSVRNNILNDFFIGDFHEDNIILTDSGDLKILDMDSCKINNNASFPSKYLTRLARRKQFNSKYVVSKENPYIIIPNENTDNYCYNMMILGTLYQGGISKLSISNFYKYISYLDSIGVCKDLIKNFCSMYTEDNTYNLYYLLDDLKDKHLAHRNIYKLKK